MTTGQAAKIIGCTARHVRYLIDVGTLPATVREHGGVEYWHITERNANRVKNKRPHSGPRPKE